MSAPSVDAVSVAATDPLYILYTSGTTGKPKGIVRDNGGHAVAMAWSFRNVYGMNPGDVWWSASDVVRLVRDEIGPVAALKQVVVVPALPKTRSGKILRRTMRGIAAGRDEPVPSTIEDPAVLDSLREILTGNPSH